LIHPVKLGDATGFLVAQGDAATFLRYEGEHTDAVFLGNLRQGIYTERISHTDEALEFEMEFAHQRLGGQTLVGRFTRPFTTPGTWLSDKTEREVARGELLRALFKRLAGFDGSPPRDANGPR
jgi:hypothetical protein